MMNQFKKAFLIDDDSITNILNEKIILKNQLVDSVQQFTNPLEALRDLRYLLREASALDFPDLIFLDINMPEMDGWKFLDELLSISQIDFNKCKVIMLSSSIDIADIQKSISYSVISKYITKPLTPDKLECIRKEEQPLLHFET